MTHLVVFCAVAVTVLLPVFAIAVILTVLDAQPSIMAFGIVASLVAATAAAVIDWVSERSE